MNKNNIAQIIVGAIVILVIGVVMGGMDWSEFDGGNTTTYEEINYESIFKDVDSTDSFKALFMKGCVEESDMEEYCSCYYDEAVSELGLSKTIKLSMDFIETNKLPDELFDIAGKCIQYFEF